MSSHVHCDNCMSLSCQQSSGCPLVPCQSKCGMFMHNCKTTDHRTICQGEHIACINAHYGCPAKMLRSRLSSHLKKCPANVILCTMEWGRHPVYSKDRSTHDFRYVPFSQPNPVLVKGYLDVELAIRDQQIINRARIEKCKQAVSKRMPERFNPETKLSYKRAAIIRQEIIDKVGEKGLRDENNLTLTPVTSHHTTAEENAEKSENNCIDLECEVFNTKCGVFSGSIPECPRFLEQYSGLGVNINIVTIPRFLKHKLFMYQVPCSQLVHRREFGAHFKNVHSDIHGGMGWMEQRCPFAQYGCPFVRNRLCPTSQEGAVVFSQDQGTFGIRPMKISPDFAEFCHLLWLPCELQEVICGWLDSFSLRNLAMTCKSLFETLHHLLPKRGIVVLKWKKRVYEDGSASWTISNKCWSFTSAFSEVHHWVHSETPIMSAHVEHCQYYHQYKSDRPFCYEINFRQVLRQTVLQ